MRYSARGKSVFRRKRKPGKRKYTNKEQTSKKLKSDERLEEPLADEENTKLEQHSSSEGSSDESEEVNPVGNLLATFGNIKSLSDDSENDEEEEGEEESYIDGQSEPDDELSEEENETVEAEELEENRSFVSGEESAEESIANEDVESNSDTEMTSETRNVPEELSSEDEEESSACKIAGAEHVATAYDPFTLHYTRDLVNGSEEQLKDKLRWKPTFLNWGTLRKVKVELPTVSIEKPGLLLLDEDDDKDLPEIGVNLKILGPSLESFYIKKQLQQNFIKLSENGVVLNDLETEVLSIISRYVDFYYPESSYEKWENMRKIYCLHALNHIIKTRRTITAHNARLNQQEKEKKKLYKDQGFTRPKVLILLPFKNIAYNVVNTIIALMFGDLSTTNIQNKSRFEEDFSPGGKSTDHINRPEDFNKIFEGDIGEDFKIGISLTKKSMKLYSEFYKSDIIIASPLGLRYTVGIKGEEEYDCDFLSSIEILIMDQADIFFMQNWDHILTLLESINKLPHDIQKLSTNLERVRLWYLDGQASSYRQTIIFASTLIDHNRALIQRTTNFAGRAQVLNLVSKGSISEIIVPSELIIYRLHESGADARFNFFTKKFLADWRSTHTGHTLLYVPDYCDYVRLVRFMREDGGSSIATINEYMVGQNSKVAKARSLFFEGKRQFLLYTERFHFYRRYRIKGVQNIIFYELPTYSHFFPEICNWMVDGLQNQRQESQLGTHQVAVLYQECNAKVVGVLGSERAAKLATSSKSIHMCTIGS